MSPNPADYYGIHRGTWTNWSRGPILGATITLTRLEGGILISFLALFVTLVGTAFWRIACFAFHHYYCSKAPRDALYHQRQAILRNSANGASGLWRIGQIIWAWRRNNGRIYSRMLPLMSFTIVCLSAFAVAGIFSSKIATATGTEVLISSPNCGYLRNLSLENANTVTIGLQYDAKWQNENANYAQQCYTNFSSAENCHNYVRKQLRWSSNRNASCPFTQKICHSDFNNLEIDTGFINSNDDLGLNSPPDEQFLWRHIVRCAPIVSEGYKTQGTYPDDDSTRYTRYHYGMAGNLPDSIPISTSDRTYGPSYLYQERSIARYLWENATSAFQDYTIG